ncbi:MAG: hypothetical protein Kow0098_27490 [Ignavibacteriaceae bacterium]
MKYLKMNFLVIISIFFSFQSYSQDVRGLSWGMDQSSVKRIESSNGISFVSNNDETMVVGSGLVDGKACMLVYLFDYMKKKLYGVQMSFNVPFLGKRQDRVDEFKEILSNKYGSYRKEGGFFIWENSRTKITLIPDGNNGTIGITYESLVKSNNSRDF